MRFSCQFLLILSLFWNFQVVFAQNEAKRQHEVDSLLRRVRELRVMLPQNHPGDWDAMMRVGARLGFFREIDSAMVVLKEVYLRCEQPDSLALKLRSTCGYACNETAMLLKERGDYVSSDSIFARGIRYFLTVKDEVGLAKCYNNIGINCMDKGKLDSAVYYFRLSIELKTRHNDKSVASPMTNIGTIYMAQKKYIEAKEYFEKALAIYEAGTRQGKCALLYNNLGQLHQATGDPATALGYYLKAIQSARKVDDSRALMSAYLNMAEVYLTRNEPIKALEYCDKAEEIAQSTNNIRKLLSVQLQRAAIFTHQKEYDKALALANNAQAQAQANSLLEDERSAWEILAKIYEAAHRRRDQKSAQAQADALQQRLNQTPIEQISRQAKE